MKNISIINCTFNEEKTFSEVVKTGLGVRNPRNTKSRKVCGILARHEKDAINCKKTKIVATY